MRTEVIVVGGGPVGLLLAGELRLGGVGVTVLERRTGASTESRASTLHARTMELFDQRGLLERLGTPPNDSRGHFAGLPLDLGGTDSPYPGQWKVPQARTEELLREWACGLGAEVLPGREVTDLADLGDQVTVTVRGPAGPARLRARYLVGCDGEQSMVRALAGFELAGTDARREILRADVTGVQIGPRRFQRLPGGLAVAARLPSGVTRVMVHEFGRSPTSRAGAPDFAEVRAAWSRVTGEGLDGARPVWVNAFDDTCRQATAYRRGRVLLAGDAAHRQLPVGGQALNLGLQDAANLGWKLAAQVRGWGPDELLDTYHAERHAVGARALTNIAAQALLLFGGPEVEPVRAVVGELLGHPVVRAHLAAMVSGLDVRYPAGTEHPLAGARMPPCTVHTGAGPRTLAEALRPGRFVLLDLTGGPGPDLGSRVRVLPATVTDSALEGMRHVLVRPDGHIAAAGPERRPPLAELRRWIAAPR
ncbi:Pentachlorophenol 4-monooxygenase [Micromonospora sp. MW-13]|uniref:FAD-dependent monooxygenase n=1 Tax=Micromonospora sp. MW-13 TaxID=2094022 RepID=UPI000E43752F|nr:FAD-dependent monooxygenase [Micromonospora sp. MW-13]RGC69347.1 Pentachlorophenol 4-monooxygenase [Micromonospora sp. MW-13]